MIEKKLMAELARLSAMVGQCRSCVHEDNEGEHGEFKGCAVEVLDDLPIEFARFVMDEANPCPWWQVAHRSGYCEKHSTFYLFSHCGCEHCWYEHFEMESPDQAPASGASKQEREAVGEGEMVSECHTCALTKDCGIYKRRGGEPFKGKCWTHEPIAPESSGRGEESRSGSVTWNNGGGWT